MYMHIHDSKKGCYDCDCHARPNNDYPCTCPPGTREGLKREGLEQSMLQHHNYPRSLLGEITKRKTTDGFTFSVYIYPEWSELVDHCDFSLSVFPKPAYPRSLRPNYPTDESHIIRGEN